MKVEEKEIGSLTQDKNGFKLSTKDKIFKSFVWNRY